MRYLIIVISLLVFVTSSMAAVPTINALSETTPIPAGIESSDDVAIWLNPVNPAESRIIGVSKNKKKDGGLSGVGLYDLQGRELQYIKYDRLNNIDLKYNFWYKGQRIDIVAASNRDKKGITLFKVTEDKLELLADLKMRNIQGELITEEPYGFCLSFSGKRRRRLYAFSPMKSGLIYQHQIIVRNGVLQARPVRDIDTSLFLDRKMDQHLMEITVKEVVYEGKGSTAELVDEITEELRDRFQLEGCVADDETGYLYYGMENLGLWKMPINPRNNAKAVLIAQASKAKSEPDSNIFDEGIPRLVNDIEGMAMHYGPNGNGALIVSIQGLDEYAFFDRISGGYIGSFKLTYGDKDPVTETDGIELISAPMGKDFPEGILVVHDHHNTDDEGNILNGNYKIISLKDVLVHFPELSFDGFTYDPRKQ